MTRSFRPKKIWLVLSVAILLLALSHRVDARMQVNVLAYVFPPFLNEDLRSGLTPELINLFNSTQDEYEFVLVPTSPKRRYLAFTQRDMDVIFFEMANWGWAAKDIAFSKTREILTGREVYITLRQKGRDQSFFDDITTKKISAFFGYHYGFADFTSDPVTLKEKFKIILNQSHERNIELVLKGAVDVGVVTKSYLDQYLVKNPSYRSQLLISEIHDQDYSLPIMVSKNSRIDVATLESLLAQLKHSGALLEIIRKYDLEHALTYSVAG